MFSREEVKERAEKTLEISRADETEVLIWGGYNALSRFAENQIHQNVSEEFVRMIVRTFFDGRMGEVEVGNPDDKTLQKAIADAIEIAKFTPSDPDLPPRPKAQQYQEINPYDPELSPLNFSPSDRAERIKILIERSKGLNLKAAGSFSNKEGFVCVSNSNGLLAFYQSSSAELSVTMMTQDSSGWAERNWKKDQPVESSQISEIAETAIKKAQLSKNPRTIEAGCYDVILEPYATAGLIQYLAYGFNALAVDEKRSYLSGKVNQKIFGDNITIWSDSYHPLHLGQPFDEEGIPKKRLVLVENGVIKGLVYDRITATKHKVEPTGHGFGGRNAYGAYPSHLVMLGSKMTIEQLIESTKHGILVSRFWYQNMVDPMKVLVTGMTRDGTFLIEDGKIVCGLKNLRFNESVIDLLNRVELMSEPRFATGSLVSSPRFTTGLVVPAIKTRDFNFTSVTEF